MNNFIASSIGTAFAEIITLPICTVKTNYQVNLHYKSIFDVIKDIYKKNGFIGFYNASLSAVSSQIISTSVKFTFYDYIKKYRGTKNNDFKNNIVNGFLAGSDLGKDIPQNSLLSTPFL